MAAASTPFSDRTRPVEVSLQDSVNATRPSEADISLRGLGLRMVENLRQVG